VVTLSTIGGIPVIFNRSDTAKAQVVLAHGAGAAMDSWFMNSLALQLAERSFNVVRFEFPYMQARRELGIRRPPDRMPRLLEYWHTVVQSVRKETSLPIIVGGKSMGGRAASQLLAENHALKGVIGGACFGYPFYPPRKPEKPRVAHLLALSKPLLICQGTRDALGSPDIIASYSLSPSITVTWLDSADHDFKPLKRSGQTQADVIAAAADSLQRWFIAHKQEY